jgi:hypothetical protein
MLRSCTKTLKRYAFVLTESELVVMFRSIKVHMRRQPASYGGRKILIQDRGSHV